MRSQRSPTPTRARPSPSSRSDRAAQPLPVRLDVGQQHHLAAARHHQRAGGLVARGVADGLEEHVAVVASTLALHDEHAVRALQVVAERGGAAQGALLVGAGEQLVDQVATDPQLALREAAHAGQLHREDRRAVLEGHQLLLAGRSEPGRPAGSRRARRPADGPARPRARRRGSAGRRVERGGSAARGARAGPSGTGPGGAARPRHAGCRSGPRSPPAGPVSSCTARAMPSRPSPDTATAVSRVWISMLRCSAPTVPRSRSLTFDSSAAVAFSWSCSRLVRQRRAGLLGQRAQQELLLARRLHRVGHDQVPERPGGAAQRVRPGPRLIRRARRTRRRRRPDASCAASRDGRGADVAGSTAYHPARRQRRHRRHRQAEDLLLAGALGHELAEHQQAAHGREQLPPEVVRQVQLRRAHRSLVQRSFVQQASVMAGRPGTRRDRRTTGCPGPGRTAAPSGASAGAPSAAGRR